MNDAERWRRVKEVFDAVLERPPESRLSFAHELCGRDAALEAEVASLLIAHQNTGSLFAYPAIRAFSDSAVIAVDNALDNPDRVLRPGDRLGPYEVTGFLAAGGMGEVYRARDTTLGRDVAIKVLSDLFLDDAERRCRFEREARLLATLNHPNIASIYGFVDSGEADRPLRGLVMELVEGETLAGRLAHGDKPGIPVREALSITRQVADALEAAHEQGIIHRDLKPGNVKVTSKGIVKVLDFGLAKAAVRPRSHETPIPDPLQSKPTELGVMVGTLPYMSPEQARGAAVDARSDIWALGCLLFELFTGRSPFEGETPSDTIARILERQPDWSVLPRETPDGIRDLLRRSLAKDPNQRIARMADVRTRIAECEAKNFDAALTWRRIQATVPRIAWAAATITVFGAGYGIYRLWPERSAPVPRLANPMQITAAVGLEDYPTWSPDGRTLAYESIQMGNWDIWVSQPGGDTAVNRTADFPGDDRYPSWSPDGRWIALWSSRDGGGYFVMPAVGGRASKIGSTPGTTAPYHGAAAWSADGTELAYVNYEPIGNTFKAFLEIVSIVSRETRRLALPGLQETRLDLSWSRDGRFMAYVDAAQPTAETTQLRILRLADGGIVDMTDARFKVRSPQWATDGRSIYFVSNRIGAADLWWQPIEQDGSPRGQPQQVTSGLEMLHATLLPTGTKLAYSKGRWVSNVWRVPIYADRPATWADAEQVTFEEAFIEMMDVSRDGQRILFSSDQSGNQDLWSMPLGGEATRLTSDSAPEWGPALSPDQHQIAFFSSRTGDREIWVMPAEGGPARQLTSSKGLDAGTGWSPDGREIAFRSERLGSSDVWVMKSDGSDPQVLAQDPAGDYSPDFSPDGRFLAFWSNRGGTHQIWRVARGGGPPEPLAPGFGPPTWSRDGMQVFFFRTTQSLPDVWAVSVDTRQARPLTRLVGRRGVLGTMATATDGAYLYFTWRDDVGDIWVSDITAGN